MMSFRLLLAAAAAALTLSAPVTAHEEGMEHPEGVIHVHEAYARVSGTASGAVFFLIHNNTQVDDRLAGARSDVAAKVELHTSREEDGVMKMIPLPDGIALPWGEMHELARGGDHIMLMGLTRALKDGDTFDLTLTFDHAPEMTVKVTVDNTRKAGEGGMEGMDHSGHGG